MGIQGSFCVTVMNDVAFTSIAFEDQRYIDQLHRLNESIRALYPLNQFTYWENEYPPGSRSFGDSLYGFKPHCVEFLRSLGYKKIVWFDPACILVDKVDYWFDIINEYGVIAAKDDNLLSNFSGPIVLDYFNVSRDYILAEGYHLVGGSLYVFNFDLQKSVDIFEMWKKCEMASMFGSAGTQWCPEWRSNRNDETAMALSLYHNGSKPVPYDLCKYNNGPGSIVIKDHFK